MPARGNSSARSKLFLLRPTYCERVLALVDHLTIAAQEDERQHGADVRGEVDKMILQSLSVAGRAVEDARHGVGFRRDDMLMLTAVAGIMVFLAGLLSIVLPVQAGRDVGLSGVQALALVSAITASVVIGLCWAVHIRFQSRLREYDEWVSEINAAFIVASTQSHPEDQQTSVLETLFRARSMLPKWLVDQRKGNLDRNLRLWLLIFFLGPPGFILLVSGFASLGSDLGVAVLMLAVGSLLVGPMVLLYGRHLSRQRGLEIQLMADWNQSLGMLMEQIDRPYRDM